MGCGQGCFGFGWPMKGAFFGQCPRQRDSGGVGRGCLQAQLPLMVPAGDASQGTASRDLVWLYLPGGKFLPVGNVLLPLFLSSPLRTQLTHRDNGC